jgi:sulfoxide reductase heme-binding subunit YedZ
MRVIKSALFLACLLPLALLIGEGAQQGLGANPVERVTHFTGSWGLRFLFATLAMTPLRMASGWSGAIKLRRMLGLFSFFYLCLHALIWIGLDREFDVATVAGDILKRPYITLGFTALCLMLPLGLTSNRWAIRRLGARWKRLHRLVYPIALLGVVHFLWLVKADGREPIALAVLLVILLLFRTRAWQRIGAVSVASPVRIPQRE